jgi:hypothetical protein
VLGGQAFADFEEPLMTTPSSLAGEGVGFSVGFARLVVGGGGAAGSLAQAAATTTINAPSHASCLSPSSR